MSTSTRLRDFAPSLIVLAISIVYALWAQIYPRGSGTVPALVAEATVVFALLDLVAHTNTRLGRLVRGAVGQPLSSPDDTKEKPASRAVALSIGWPLVYVGAVIAFGFLVATPAYTWLYMWLYGRKSFVSSAMAACLTTLVIWFTFEVLFRYPLYPGMLFGGGI